MQKLEILTDAAKYDVACTSSGVERKGDREAHGELHEGRDHHNTAGCRCIPAFC